MAAVKNVMGFELGEVMGRGGFGFVKRATLNGRDYAMKILTKGSAGWNAQEEEMVRTEIDIMKKLDHPNIIKVHSCEMNGQYPREDGAVEDCVIIVMEMAQGGNLFDVLFYTEGFSEAVTRTYLWQLVDAIGSMHNMNIAHRDIKPQNTLLDSNFNVKICDFGLSKQTDGASLMRTRLGTLPFQAPEMLMQREYDYGVDIFALGVLYFLMLSGGVPPFKSADTKDKWFKCIAGHKIDKFWKRHKAAKEKIAKTSGAGGFEDATNLFFSMCAYQPTQRADIKAVADNPWLAAEKKTGKALYTEMSELVNNAMEEKRKNPDEGGQISGRVRAICIAELDMDQHPPEDPTRFVPNFTYEIFEDHPFLVFKSIEDFLISQGVEPEKIVFNEQEFVMSIEADMLKGKKANIIVSAFQEDGTNFLSFKNTNVEVVETGTRLLIGKIINRHCEQFGDVKIAKEQPGATEEDLDFLRQHMANFAGAN